MRLLRVEVYRAGVLLEARTTPNLIAAQIYAAHQRARGLSAIVTYPRRETAS